MADEQWQQRMDERWERMDARWERMDARWERFEARCERADAALEIQNTALEIQNRRTEAAYNDLREYMAQATAALALLARQIDEHREEFVAESRAGRAALLAVLDRLNGPDGGAEPA